MKKNASPIAIWAAMISVYVAWGYTYLAFGFAIESIPPFLMAGFRFVFAGSLLYAWRRLSGGAPPTRIHRRSAAVVEQLLLLGGTGVVVWTEQRVPPASLR